MKNLVNFIFAIGFVIVIGILIIATTQTDAQGLNNGVTVRPDGSIIIDTWKYYSPIAPGAPTTAVPEVRTETFPKKIIFGASLTADTIVCFEGKLGMTCELLDVLRHGGKK